MKNIYTLSIVFIIGLHLSACQFLPNQTETNRVTTTQDQAVASRSQHLSGKSAIAFIKAHFPDADIPGTVEGVYYTKEQQAGYAKCFYPAMGARSMGQVPTCDLQ